MDFRRAYHSFLFANTSLISAFSKKESDLKHDELRRLNPKLFRIRLNPALLEITQSSPRGHDSYGSRLG